MFLLEFSIVLLAMFIGARFGGIFLGMAGGMGVAVLAFGFGITPTSPPMDVMLIIMAVVVAASTLQAAGGMDYLVQIAEKLLRRNPEHITFLAPFIAYAFTFCSGTGNVAYSILPVIAEVARESGVRPERPISISVIASQQAITACPISAATVTLLGLLSPFGITLIDIMMICIPASLVAIFCGALYANRMGKKLELDEEYQRRIREGLISSLPKRTEYAPATKQAKISVLLFLLGALLVVLFGTFPSLRPVLDYSGKLVPLNMTHAIEITMLAISAIMVILCKVDVNKIIDGSVFRSGSMGVICIFGLAWMGDSFVASQMGAIKQSVQEIVATQPWVFAIALFAVSTLTLSQAATTRALMPLGIALGIPAPILISVFPSVNGYFFFPNYATVIAGIAFDRTGTTRIGRFVLNHSYMMPGLITSVTSVMFALVLTKIYGLI